MAPLICAVPDGTRLASLLTQDLHPGLTYSAPSGAVYFDSPAGVPSRALVVPMVAGESVVAGQPSTLLRLFIERRGDNLRFHSLSANFHSDRPADRSVLWWYVCQSNILLQIRGVRTAGHVPDLGTGVVQHFVAVASDAALDHLQANQPPLQSFGAS